MAKKKTSKKAAKTTAMDKRISKKAAKKVIPTAKKSAMKSPAVKTSAGNKTTMAAKAKPAAAPPSEAQISEVAYLLYLERLAQGREGNEESDWLAAKEALMVA